MNSHTRKRTQAYFFADRLQHNFQQAKKQAAGADIFPVIKANAYGHGMEWAAQQLPEADGFCVAICAEAIRLRDAGIEKKVMVLQGANNTQEWEWLAANHCEAVVHSEAQLMMLCEIDFAEPLVVWLKVDSGMHRLGLSAEKIVEAQKKLSQSNVQLAGIMMHFACADEKAHALNQQQIDVLQKLQTQTQLPVSCSNSAALYAFDFPQESRVRPGIMIYGASPFGVTEQQLGLLPVMELRSHVLSVQSVKQGETVGYGASWQAAKDSRIAIIAIGYGDGYPRSASSRAQVYINGQYAKVVGRVSMDSIAVDVSDLDGVVDVGTEVELWGQHISADAVAESAQTISYELFCQITERVERIYQ